MTWRRLGPAWIAVAAWTVVAAFGTLLTDWLIETNIALLMLGTAFWLLVGAILLLVLLGKLEFRPAVALVAFAVLIAVSPLKGIGGRAWFWISFKQNEAAYRAVVARADELPRAGEHAGVRYAVEPGPPRRIAFRQPVGLAGDWGAVVHDPSGRVAEARGRDRDGRLTTPTDLQELWGGDLADCVRITGPWYRCWFS